jgi:hypothetical protein
MARTSKPYEGFVDQIPPMDIHVVQQPATPGVSVWPSSALDNSLGVAYDSRRVSWARAPAIALGKFHPCLHLSQAPIPAKLL